MPIWAWVLLATAGLAALLTLSFRVRYRLAWHGEWDLSNLRGGQGGSISLQWGWPGLMFRLEPAALRKLFETPPATEPAKKPEAPAERTAAADPAMQRAVAPQNSPSESSAENSSAEKKIPAPAGDPHRWRRALFQLATDPKAWLSLGRYGIRLLKLLLGLTKPRLSVGIGHPDPAKLGRWAGHWYSVRPFLPLRHDVVNFRFQDRAPSLHVEAEGGVSVFGVLVFLARALFAFPWILLARRAWRGWRRHRLTGWRAALYAEIQKRA